MLNVKEELAKGRIMVRIKDLFSEETARNASREFIGSIFILCLSKIIGTGAMVAAIHFIKRRKQKAAVANIVS